MESFSKFLVILSVLSIVLISGCTASENDAAKGACISACKQMTANGTDLSDGPCLLDPIPNTGWVCDVAHSPRTSIDDNPANQCVTYGSAAKHFVEVTPGCEFVRGV